LISLRYDQLAEMIGGTVVARVKDNQIFTGVSTDSRTVKPGEMFIAIKGEHFDGHNFIDQAISRGADGLLVSHEFVDTSSLPDKTTIVSVTHPHEAMMSLASQYLYSLPAHRIGITGSNGKTGSKEFTYQLLSLVAENIYCTPGNYNNLFGIPLALLAMPQTTEYAILEMGISTPGEMQKLSRIVKPEIAVITNVSATHLQYLGSVENVAREKLSLLSEAADNAQLIINVDDPVLVSECRNQNINAITFGINNIADFTADNVIADANGFTQCKIDGKQFNLALFGQYQVYNLLAAYSIVRTLGYSFDNYDTFNLKLDSVLLRGEKVISGGVTFIVDCYNANPDSVRSGLESFGQLSSTGRRIIILGDMLELGKDETAYHITAGEQLAVQEFDIAIVVGKLSEFIQQGAIGSGLKADQVLSFTDTQAAADFVKDYLQEDDLVYLKGSRGIGLEKILDCWKQKGGDN